MKKEHKIEFILWLALIMTFTLTAAHAGEKKRYPLDVLADSLVRLTFERARDSVGLASEYNAQLYIEGQVNVRKKNVFYHQLPQ